MGLDFCACLVIVAKFNLIYFITSKKSIFLLLFLTTSYLRELPELAKQFVMRTLFADQPIPETLVAAWVKAEHQKYDIIKSSCIGHLILLY